MEPSIGVTTYKRYEVTDGEGSTHIGTEERQAGQCDHCHELDKAWEAIRSSIESREIIRSRRAESVPEVRWQDVWWAAFIWGMVSILPLGLALAGIRSFALLGVGMVIIAGVGGVRSYSRQIRRIENAKRRNDNQEQKESPELEALLHQMAALDEVRRGNANRIKI
jgi:hypothetical protein